MRFLALIVIVVLFTQCKDSSTDEPSPVVLEETSTVEILFNNDISEQTTISSVCEKLGKQYESLIAQLNRDKENKQLITELVDWTKNPAHLKCLENDEAYNKWIEELNQLL